MNQRSRRPTNRRPASKAPPPTKAVTPSVRAVQIRSPSRPAPLDGHRLRRLPRRFCCRVDVPARWTGVRRVRAGRLLGDVRSRQPATEPVGRQHPLDVPQFLVQFPIVVARRSRRGCLWRRGRLVMPPIPLGCRRRAVVGGVRTQRPATAWAAELAAVGREASRHVLSALSAPHRVEKNRPPGW